MANTKTSVYTTGSLPLLVIIIILAISTHGRNALWESGLSLWGDNVAKSPLKARAQTNLGTYQYKDKNYSEGEKSFLRSIKADPNYYKAYLTLGLLYKDTNRLNDAERILAKSLEITETHTAYNILGSTYRKMQNHYKAIESYTKAIELKSDYPEAINNLANVYIVSGEPKKAIETYRKIEALNPYIDEVYNNLGLAHQMDNNFYMAEENFKKALSINSANHRTYANLGTLYFYKDDFSEAIKYYLKAVEVNESFAEGYHNTGVCFERLGDFENAVNYYQKALQVDPKRRITEIFLKKAMKLKNTK